MKKYSQKYLITNDSMDINYRLRPISAIMYFQDCIARYMTVKNLAAFDIVGKHLFWIVSEFNIQFEKELPFWSEEIEVITWVSEVSKLKVYIDFELKHNDEIFAKGNSLWFILNSETKRPTIADNLFGSEEIITETALGEHQKFQTAALKEKIQETTHKTNLSDLDFNYHVNNKSYINLAEKTCSEDFKKSHTLKKLSVKYNKESFLGDTLVCSTYTTNEEQTLVHKIERDGVSVCDLSTCWIDKIKETPILDVELSVRKNQNNLCKVL